MSKHVPNLYHFTCEHGHKGIEETGILLPNKHPYMPGLGPLLWLTDLAEPPTRESVGLTSRLTTCDRMAYRYIVRSKAAVHWRDIRPRVTTQVVADLEAFGQPEHWWIIRRTVLASEFAFDGTWNNREVAS